VASLQGPLSLADVGGRGGVCSSGWAEHCVSFPQGPMAEKSQAKAPKARSPSSISNGKAMSQGQWGRAW
jgi:hypothetical protein